MSKMDLTATQRNDADALDETLFRVASLSDGLKQYKLGDIYIFEDWDESHPKQVYIEKTSMGCPVKYKVVYVSPFGIPYLRKLTPTGRVTGDSLIPPEFTILNILKNICADNSWDLSDNRVCQRFALDPEQLDSILLQTPFDPTAQHRDKAKLFHEINKHNKRITINTISGKHSEWFKARKPGDTFWTSPNKQFVIQSVVKATKQWEITAIDMNQATVTFSFADFFSKRLYSEQPRSFSKETKNTY